MQGWGKTIILGVEKHGSPISFSPGEILWGRTITGASLGGIKPKSEIPALIQRYLDKVIDLNFNQILISSTSTSTSHQSVQTIRPNSKLQQLNHI